MTVALAQQNVHGYETMILMISVIPVAAKSVTGHKYNHFGEWFEQGSCAMDDWQKVNNIHTSLFRYVN